jgi:predicted N-acetyltransferase YhbS
MSLTIAARPYTGAADLRRLQDAASACFGRGVDHPGDLAWWMRDQAHVQLTSLVRLLESPDGALLGWTWVHPSGGIDAVPVADLDAGLAGALADAALDSVNLYVTAGDPMPALRAFCDEADGPLIAAFEERGFALTDESFEITRRELRDLPEAAALAPGLRLAAVSDEALVHAKVECHRAAFSPSALTVAGYRRVRRTWPYRAELDRVVVDDTGTVLSTCLAWIDEATGWGLLEPVGTRPEHQRRGLGTAVCLDALHALRDAGATHAQVGCDVGSAGCRMYHGLGFRTERRLRWLRRGDPPFTH